VLPSYLQVFGAVCTFYATDQLEEVIGLGEQTE
jgi:hypothetical protein